MLIMIALPIIGRQSPTRNANSNSTVMELFVTLLNHSAGTIRKVWFLVTNSVHYVCVAHTCVCQYLFTLISSVCAACLEYGSPPVHILLARNLQLWSMGIIDFSSCTR